MADTAPIIPSNNKVSQKLSYCEDSTALWVTYGSNISKNDVIRNTKFTFTY